MSKNIFLDKIVFDQTRLKQQSAADRLRNEHDVLQSAFGAVGTTWKGAGGEAFRECAKAITSQTLMGVLMLTSFSNRATTAHAGLVQMDTLLTSKFK